MLKNTISEGKCNKETFFLLGHIDARIIQPLDKRNLSDFKQYFLTKQSVFHAQYLCK